MPERDIPVVELSMPATEGYIEIFSNKYNNLYQFQPSNRYWTNTDNDNHK